MILCFLQDSLSSIMHDRIITVQGCCKSGSCIFTWHPDKRGRYITVVCNKLSKWRGLKLDSCSGWCCLAVWSLAGGWQVPTKSPLRGTKLGIVAERPSSCTESEFPSLPFPHSISGIYSFAFLVFIKCTWTSKHSGHSATKTRVFFVIFL